MQAKEWKRVGSSAEFRKYIVPSHWGRTDQDADGEDGGPFQIRTDAGGQKQL